MSHRKLLNSELGRLSPEQYRQRRPGGVAVVLDNIRSAHNVGSAFRTADAFGVDRMYLCGICACPPSAEIHKSALGAEQSVAWEHWDDTVAAVQSLKAQGWTIVCVEQTEGSVSLESFVKEDGRKYAVVFGNEVDGVQQSVADLADIVLEIPHWGTKHSLNVSVAVGVILWHFRP